MDFEIMVVLAILSVLIVIFINYLIGRAKNNYTNAKSSNSEIGNLIRNSESIVNSQYTKVKRYAQRNISKSFLTGCTWILSNEISENVLYTFRQNGELLITTNGIVQKSEYEIIIDNNSILIIKDGVIEHYSILNIYDDFLFLNKISSSSVLVFANQTKYKDELKTNINEQAKKLFDYQKYN